MRTKGIYFKMKEYIWNNKIKKLIIYRNKNILENIPYINTKKGKCLDVGTLDGSLLKELRKKFNCEIIGLDVKKIKIKGFKFIQADASKIPLESNSLDIITGISLIEHLENKKRQKFYSEAQRLLKKRGYLILQIPNRFFPIEHHSFLPFVGYLPSRTHKFFFREYYLDLKSIRYYTKELKSNGFEVEIKAYSFPREFSPLLHKILSIIFFHKFFPFGYIIIGRKI